MTWKNFQQEQHDLLAYKQAGRLAKGRRGLVGAGEQPNPLQHAVVDSTGQAWVRLEDVTELINDNEFMREELYMQQAYWPQRCFDQMQAITGQSTRDVLKTVKRIEKLSKNEITGQMLFRNCYSFLYRVIGLNFGDCPQGKSKLQWLWQLGGLPIVSMYMLTFEHMLIHLERQHGTSFITLIKQLKKKMQPPTTKKVKKKPF